MRVAPKADKSAPKLPPTQAQLERIDSMIDHPAFDHHMDSLTRRVDSMLKTRGGAGLLIGWMKNEIKKYDEHQDAQFTGGPPQPVPCQHIRMVNHIDRMGNSGRQCLVCNYWEHDTSTKEDSK